MFEGWSFFISVIGQGVAKNYGPLLADIIIMDTISQYAPVIDLILEG